MNSVFPAAWRERMQQLVPAGEQDAFFAVMATPLKKSIRVNTLAISVEEFQGLATELGWTLTPIPWCETGFWIDRVVHKPSLGKTWLYAAGLFYIQEAASMLPPELLYNTISTPGVEMGELVLDVSAAPGSKTTQIAGKARGQGIVLANEPTVSRIKALSHNLELMGAGNALLARKDGRAFPKYFPNTFHRILLDAPCTGEGTARKDSDALARWSLRSINTMADLQKQLAIAAFHALAPGGEMVYSTCTFAPEENEWVVSELLRAFGDEIELIPAADSNGVTAFGDLILDPRVAGCRRLWPHRDHCEGFFAAKLRKLAPTSPKLAPPLVRSARTPFQPVLRRSTVEFTAQIEGWFGVQFTLPTGWMFFVRDEELWIRPTEIERWAQRFDFERTGSRIAKLSPETGKIIRISNLGAKMFLKFATKHVVDLDLPATEIYLNGRDLPYAHGESEIGQVVVRHRGFVLGLGLLRDGKLKNQLPREFIIQ